MNNFLLIWIIVGMVSMGIILQVFKLKYNVLKQIYLILLGGLAGFITTIFFIVLISVIKYIDNNGI